MSASTSDQTERLVQFSRRQLLCVLAFLLLLGASYLVDLLVDVRTPPALSAAVSVAMVVAGAVFGSKTAGLDFSKSNPAMKALHNDELRKLAQAKAFRNGFFVLLAYPPICAFTLTWLAVANPLPILVESGAWLGAIVCLSSLLWYDR